VTGPRIAYLVQQFPPEVGAGPARVTEMALRWHAAGSPVTIVTGFPARSIPGHAYGTRLPEYRGRMFTEETWNGLRVLRSWLYNATRPGIRHTLMNNTSFAATATANALSRLDDPQVMIASAPPFFPHIAGLIVSRLRHVPLVLEVRDLWPDYLLDMGVVKEGSFAARALFALERYLLRSADHVVVVTESFRERIVAKGVARERITVVPNGVDLEQYAPSTEPPPIPELAANGHFRVGYLGTFGAGQALQTVIDAGVLLRDTDPDVRIVIAGDGLERDRLEAHVAATGATNVIVHRPIAKEQTRAFYNSCDVCLVPLAPLAVFHDTIPSKIFEVMACERPVVAGVRGEGRRIVADSGGGVAIEPGDARALADAIRTMKATPLAARQAMGRRGRAYVAANYDRAKLADRYYRLLTALAR
jgi:glycosyltransferase involved in cell wall biosynthesis